MHFCKSMSSLVQSMSYLVITLQEHCYRPEVQSMSYLVITLQEDC